MQLVHIIMAFAPFGVAALMAWVAGAIGFSVLVPLAKYVVGVMLGVFLHGAIVYGLIVCGYWRRQPDPLLQERAGVHGGGLQHHAAAPRRSR